MPGRSGSGPSDPGEVEQAQHGPGADDDGADDHQAQLAHRLDPAAAIALLRRHLESGVARAEDAAQGAGVDLHRQQLVVGGLADLHVAAGEG